MYGVPSPIVSTGPDREVSLSLRRRRDAYTRRQTVAALSAHGHAITGSHVTEGASGTRRLSRSSTGSANEPMSSDPLQGQVQVQGQCPASSGHLSKANSRRSSKKLVHIGRTASSSSVLLHKVREIIREKVIEASVDGGPDAAAVERARRQRAADAFEVQRRRQQMTRQTSSTGDRWSVEGGGGGGCRSWNQSSEEPCSSNAPTMMAMHSAGSSGSNAARPVAHRTRIRSDPARRHSNEQQNSFERDCKGARLAFSQRSNSEDTYTRRYSNERHAQSHGSAAGRKGGVICYDDDLRAITFKYKTQSASVTSRSSSTPQQHRASRASSLDAGQNTVFASFESLQVRTPSPRTSDAKIIQDLPVPPTRVSELPQPSPEREPGPVENEGIEVDRMDIAVRDVEFDELGQTWDVYGAEFDPELLGEAIQTHLERIMKERRCTDGASTLTPTDCRHLGSDDTLDSLSEASNRNATSSLCFFRYLCTSV